MKQVKQELCFLDYSHYLAVKIDESRGLIKDDMAVKFEAGKYKVFAFTSMFQPNYIGKSGKDLRFGFSANLKEDTILLNIQKRGLSEQDVETIKELFDERTISTIIANIHTKTELGQVQKVGCKGSLNIWNNGNYQVVYRK